MLLKKNTLKQKKMKEVDVTELELGQFCYDTPGDNKDKFIFCGIIEE